MVVIPASLPKTFPAATVAPCLSAVKAWSRDCRHHLLSFQALLCSLAETFLRDGGVYAADLKDDGNCRRGRRLAGSDTRRSGRRRCQPGADVRPHARPRDTVLRPRLRARGAPPVGAVAQPRRAG